MTDSRKQYIESSVNKHKDRINTVDDCFYVDMSGVTQAVAQLKNALGKVSACLNQREFEQASSLGYSDGSSEFIFLQRCLGALNDTVMQKEKLTQDICLEVSRQLESVKNEEVAVLVEKQMDSLKPVTKPAKIEILLGKETVSKLHSLQNIRDTPIEHLVELIVASAMKNDEKHWQALEKDKSPIANSKTESKEYSSVNEVSIYIKALTEQEENGLTIYFNKKEINNHLAYQ